MMLTGPYNATRHPQKPLPQPNYNFGNVPQAVRTLEHSSLHSIDNREHFLECMAEMLLLCKEAMRRRPSKSGCGGGSKPLSLEYLADRMDIDDPCFGYLVRTHEHPLGRKDKNWRKGMLQGFITCTTFTNWQRTFRWDSENEMAYECDTVAHSDPARTRDVDGSLARELQASVHGGDINMEGIVWPHVAEISLLGALGCGRVSLPVVLVVCSLLRMIPNFEVFIYANKIRISNYFQTLIEFAIEQLECMKPTAKANYDYVVLQATDNSIPFYESMGFVRVGTVMKDETARTPKASSDSNDDGDSKPAAMEDSFVTSTIVSYVVKSGETLTRIALKFEVDVWDIIFLNRHILGETAKPCDKPLKNLILMIPTTTPAEKAETKPTAVPREEICWHVAKENETPRTIAKKFDLRCEDVVRGNKGRLPGLMASSRLKDGTRVKISHLDVPENNYQAYAHWSFPDRDFEEPEPSYMMARKLNRRKQKDRDYRPVQSSLKGPVLGYEPTALLLPASPTPDMPVAATAAKPTPKSSVKRQKHPNEPKPPKRPLTAYMRFASEQKELTVGEVKSENAKYIRGVWNDLPRDVKAVFEREAATEKALYLQEKAKYEEELLAFYESNPDDAQPVASLPPPPSTGEQSIKFSLYNKVVRLKEGAMTEGSDYTYWYVLTFIPDLKWCHLAPMIQDGTFGPEKARVEGRAKWKLVDESLGHEVDISSSFVIPIKSKSMRKTLDADKEEWDIIDDGTDPTKMPAITPRVLACKSSGGLYLATTERSRSTIAAKPSAQRVTRKKKSLVTVGAVAESPSLLATLPGSGLITTVRLVGKNIFLAPEDEPARKPKRSSVQLSTISERRASPRRQSSVVRFDSPTSAAASQPLKNVYTPSSILRKGGRKRKTDGPHIGSCERQNKRRRTTDAILLLDAPMSDSSDDNDAMSDASEFSDVKEETKVVACRSSPRLNKLKSPEDEGSPASRTRRSLANAPPNSSSLTFDGDASKDEEKVPVPSKRSTRASRGEPDSAPSPTRRSRNPSSSSRAKEPHPSPERSTRTSSAGPKTAASPARRSPRSPSPSMDAKESHGESKTSASPERHSTRSRSPDRAAVDAGNILETTTRLRRSTSRKSEPASAPPSELSRGAVAKPRRKRSPDKAAVDAGNILETTSRLRRSTGHKSEPASAPPAEIQRWSVAKTRSSSSPKDCNQNSKRGASLLRESSLNRSEGPKGTGSSAAIEVTKSRPKRKSAPTSFYEMPSSPPERRSSRRKV